ncbi:hypothetical protein GIY30_23640 [Gordonia sp. HNM0687]|uniref:Secreted protein n=1 Tax=Gordonia mangrovi TaxID=2665643 RepID=A0A6L7GWE7_9ACTN|nr:hypothetical protein [Gordonia mangrovi]MXP24319.1 hypothetical protein [Gordonia mangrovi]UVF79865.1 hypothetical protein NWF22_08600 [Gordonia mangrovi]
MGRRGIAIACTAGAVAAGLTVGAASAQAQAPAQTVVVSQPIGPECWAPSPHILDLPLHGGAAVRTDARRPGVFAVWGHGMSFFRYTVDTWVTIHHLPTGHIETFYRRWQPQSVDVPGYRIDNLHASGPIRLRIRSVTHGPVSLPPVICTGRAVV